MEQYFELVIADVLIFAQATSLNQRLSSIKRYEHFCEKTIQSRDDPDIKLEIRCELLPKIKEQNKIFDTNKLWSIYASDDGYSIALKSVNSRQPLWIARINCSFNKGTVFLNNKLVAVSIPGKKFFNPISYPLDQILLVRYLTDKQGALFHAAGINLYGKGYIFPGISGAGKSTLSKQFITDKGATILCDDRIIIRRISNEYRAYGTPWKSDGGTATNTNAPLAGIFFLKQGPQNSIRKIQKTVAVKRLMSIISIPWYDPRSISDLLDFCDNLLNDIPVYELTFLPSSEVVDVFKEFLATSNR